RPYVLIHGDRVLMYIKTDPFEKYVSKDHSYYLQENKNIYDIRKHNGVNELIEKDCDYNREDSLYSSLFVHLKTD
ncbi:MAG: hypothetical protein IIU29_03990, partial [Erysipelotrichaceae bacterium]|nr:hypothetical protein [Erysipelotrichaceae bacterium]